MVAISGVTRKAAFVGMSAFALMVTVAPAASAAAKFTPPTNVTAKPGDQSAKVAWTAPSSAGGSTITGYTVTSSPGSKTCTTSKTSCTVKGLTNGTAYTFTVTAKNKAGKTKTSVASKAVVPATVPGQPTTVQATGGNGQAVVTWKAPTKNGGAAITGYTVTSKPGSKTCSAAATATTCTVTGLANGTSYTFTVTAKNVMGTGLPSAASGSVTPATVPEAPYSLSIKTTDSTAALTWKPPAKNGGAAVTTYTVMAVPNNKELKTRRCSTATLGCSVTDLTNGELYTFYVSAFNRAGESPKAELGPIAVFVKPSYPENVVATAYPGGSIQVDWDAPEAVEGVPVDGYIVRISPDGDECYAMKNEPTTCTFSGLTPVTEYTFTVVAFNNAGESPASSPIAPVTALEANDYATNVSSGRAHTCATMYSGEMKCWGLNKSGQLGTLEAVYAWASPLTITTPKDFTDVSAGDDHTCAIDTNSDVWCWGDGLYGATGPTAASVQEQPLKVVGVANATSVSSGSSHTCATIDDGTIKCWGLNTSGQLGNSTFTTSSKPVTVTGIDNAVSVSSGTAHTCATLDDDTVKCWGLNTSGQLGNGTVTTSNKPVLLKIADVANVSAGGTHTCAANYDGAVLCWGSGTYGQNGNATKKNQTAPTEVAGLSTASYVTAGGTHTCAALYDGGVACWGNNDKGQLGLNPTTVKSTATPTISDTGVEYAEVVEAGTTNTCAVFDGGQVACWGEIWQQDNPDAEPTQIVNYLPKTFIFVNN